MDLRLSLLIVFSVFATNGRCEAPTIKLSRDSVTVYLVGISHAADASLWPIPPTVEEIYNHADALAEELDRTDSGLVASIQEELRRAMRRGSTIGKRLPPATIDSAFSVFGKRVNSRVEKQQFLDYEPCLVYAALSTQSGTARIAQRGIPYEVYFGKKAREDNKEIISMEPDGSTKACERLNSTDLNALIEGAIQLALDSNLSKKLGEDVEQASKDLATGNSALSRPRRVFVLRSVSQSHALAFDHFIKERNLTIHENLLSWITAHPTGNIMVLLGAMHLAGTDGLIDLMIQDGFAVSSSSSYQVNTSR